ncbi:response regulator [Paenibacillus psychroresistens]|uniref:Response regulator n=1 Tax=Paenibacillus psychroresistens TaxID=1778678 RepID=A0A6B8RQM1_9BACL|nr:response regulator [Paenibacillus psychroresistens]QGQ98680.1 response regulator [Paenibacillus psychroresistens]
MKLLIVDDEIQIRQGLREGIDWQSLGFEEVFVAENGIEALEIYRSFQPDLVLTDVRMPGMDGLELCRRIRVLSTVTKIVILSGYSDFEYAKQALQAGVSEYELKPIKLRSLIQLVTRIKDDILKEKIVEKEQHNNQARRLLERMISGEIANPLEIKQGLLKYYRLQIGDELVCLAIDLDHIESQEIKRRNVSEEASVFHYLHKELNDLCKTIQGIVYERSQKAYYILASPRDGAMIKRQLPLLFSSINERLNTRYGKSISMGISSRGSLKNLQQLFTEADQTLQRNLFHGRCHFLYFEDIQEYAHNKHIYVLREKELTECIIRLDFEAARIIVDDEFARISELRELTIFQVKSICLDLLNILIHSLGKQHVDVDTNELDHLRVMEDYKMWVLGFYNRVFSDLYSLQTTKYNTSITKAIEYLKKHYSSEISIESVAEIIGITPNYFSHLFKKETNIPFSEFLNTVRIHAAKNLLKQSNDKVYEISEKVGFQDIKYFNQVFKKIEGKSPKEYRSQVSL